MKEKYEVESTHKNAKFAIKKVTNMQNFLLKREKLSVAIDSCQGNVRIVLGDKNKLTFNTKEERDWKIALSLNWNNNLPLSTILEC